MYYVIILSNLYVSYKLLIEVNNLFFIINQIFIRASVIYYLIGLVM